MGNFERRPVSEFSCSYFCILKQYAVYKPPNGSRELCTFCFVEGFTLGFDSFDPPI